MPQQLVWRCTRGTSRKFYTLSVERDLWGNRAIVRRWGRMDGGHTGVCVHWEPELSFAELARQVHQRRRWHRYELVEDPNRTLSSSPGE